MPIRDSLLKQIEDALGQALDGNEFEAAMCSMLREQRVYPNLVPIRGGNDAGMDGAIGDPTNSAPPIPLACTTQEDVKANLIQSLSSYAKNGGAQRRVILATSRSLTPAAQRDLTAAANQMGFHLLNIHERAAVAELLYYSPRWCRDLLAITTMRPALSAFPQDQRPFFHQLLRGRDREFDWLKNRTGDALVIGQPGIGKTFLMRHYCDNIGALFAVTDDLDAIDAGIREHQPGCIIVSDIHARPALLRGLRQLRSDTCGTWKIIADCWPGAEAEVRNALCLSKTDALELHPLPRDTIVEIIRDAGLIGPTELVRELVDQSRGRAGLAVTLTFLCLRGDTRRVGLGQVLAEQIQTTFKTLVGSDASNLLTMFALGGRSGFEISPVAQELGQSDVQVQQSVVHLAAGGVVDEVIDYEGRRRIAVQPEALRDAIVGDRFFGKFPLPLPDKLLSTAKAATVTEVFLGAKHRGAAVPNELLWRRLSQHGTPELFKSYIALGEQEAERTLTEHPEILPEIAPIGLRAAPRIFIPSLLNASVGDTRDTNSATRHPLRQIEDWVHSGRPGSDALGRRRSLIDAVERWLLAGGDPDTAMRAASLALNPVFRTSNSDPGSGRTLTLTHGVIRANEIVGLEELWDRVIRFVPPLRVKNWKPLLNAVSAVASPQILGGNPGEDFFAVSKSLANKIISTLAGVLETRPGVVLELREIAYRLGFPFNGRFDGDFVTLYPDVDYTDHNSWFKRATEAVQNLGYVYAARPPKEVAESLASYAREADAAGRTTNLLWVLGNTLAAKVLDVEIWVNVLADTSGDGEIVAHLLQRLRTEDYDKWLGACWRCWSVDRLRPTVIAAVLTTDRVSDDLAAAVLMELPKYSQLVEVLCLRGQVTAEFLRKLFCHLDDGVAAAAAVGEWHADPKGKIRSELHDCWRSALIRCGSKRQRETSRRLYIREILESEPGLAFDWLLARIQDGTPLYELEDYDLDGAIPTLSPDQRLTVLLEIGANQVYAPEDLVLRLISNGVDLYRRLLAEPNAKRLHLVPLAGKPSQNWLAMAIAALDSGYTPQTVLEATESSTAMWSGEESAHWEGWRIAWEGILPGQDSRLTQIAKLGTARAIARRDRALRIEEVARVYGD